MIPKYNDRFILAVNETQNKSGIDNPGFMNYTPIIVSECQRKKSGLLVSVMPGPQRLDQEANSELHSFRGQLFDDAPDILWNSGIKSH